MARPPAAYDVISCFQCVISCITVRPMLAIILYSILQLNRNFISVNGAKLLRGNARPTYVGTVTGAFIYQQAHTKFLSIRSYMPT